MKWLIEYGIWAVLGFAVVAWELLALFVRRGWLIHPTISRIVRRWEGITPEGAPDFSGLALARRLTVFVILTAAWTVLVLHWVLAQF